ncbi:unnamed protein product [Moneuplotes crassus]|uniref:Uncharacterized protein n=1 Tax=Euplotes crassus TaxID=5936 RepID=A0AAD1URH2_EUPCR|nr:unnamed protein product [Moneuplotes crassus]
MGSFCCCRRRRPKDLHEKVLDQSDKTEISKSETRKDEARKDETRKDETHKNEEIKYSKTESKQETDPRLDRAKGCVVGALCGDAAGAVLEFHRGEITKTLCNKAVQMLGGGVFKVGPGQVTDDGELTMCLLHALVNSGGKFQETEVAKYYGKWYRSNPFDCGITIGNALSVADPDDPNPDDIKKEAEKLSQGSQSNGSLMRATPLAVFCHNMKTASAEDFDAEEWKEHKACVFEAAKLDASFTHPSPAVHYVEGLYIYMMTLIINGVKLADVYNTIIDEIDHLDKEEYKDLILEWVDKSKERKLGSLEHQMGWMKHAFICCLRYLRLAKESEDLNEPLDSTFYEEAMVKILMGGGDTDTNACIAGGLIGAIVGFKGLPEEAKTKVLNWDNNKEEGHERPEFLVPSIYAENLIERLYDSAATDFEID